MKQIDNALTKENSMSTINVKDPVSGKLMQSEEETERIKIETARTEAFEMEYFRFGHGSENLVILPGISVQSVMLLPDMVADAYKVLADDFTLYVFDRRKEVPEGYSIDEMAEDTAAALCAAGLKRVSVMGVSQGGMIAMKMAVLHPELVQSLILACSSAHVKEDTDQVFNEWIKLAENGDAEALYLSFGENVYSRKMFDKTRDLLVSAAKGVTEEELKRFIIFAKSMLDFDIRNDLEKIECPVFVIGAEDDRVLQPYSATEIAEHFSGRHDFQIRMYDGYGHAVFDEAPDFKESVLKFLLELKSGTA